MISNQNFDISLTNNNSQETELVEVNSNNSIDKKTGYSNLSTSEISSSTDFGENIDNEEDIKNLKDQFKDSINKDNLIVKKIENKKTIKYRKGNLHTFFYNNKGNPRIVIGQDCKN